jgi:hypothetical protein
MILWHYKGKWNISTKGSPDAGGNVGDFDFTFADLFWKTLKKYVPLDTNGQPLGVFNPMYTYMIELTSIYNRVVCMYGKDPALTLIGVREVSDFLTDKYGEVPVYRYDGFPIPVVKEFPLNSISEIEKAALALDPMHNEGFVVVDGNFNRVKVKSPSYVMIHHMKDGFGQRRIIRLIQLGETSEVLSYFPEYQDLFNEVKDKIDQMIATIEAEYAAIKHLTDRKAFALEAVKSKNSGVLFALFLGKATDVREHVLFSKKRVPGGEDFAFSPDKIEVMAGLKSRPDVTVEV